MTMTAKTDGEASELLAWVEEIADDLGQQGHMSRASKLYQAAALLRSLTALSPASNEAVEALREALVKCRDKFRFYEDLHRLKCTSEGDEKADRNREMADLCDAALSASGKGEGK